MCFAELRQTDSMLMSKSSKRPEDSSIYIFLIWERMVVGSAILSGTSPSLVKPIGVPASRNDSAP